MTTAFIDCETTDIEPGPFTIWELALILREDEGPDREVVWQMRPDTGSADANALRLNRYYERCKPDVRSAPEGFGVLVSDTGAVTTDLERLSGARIAAGVAEYLAGAVLVGANVGSFDVQHLDRYLRYHGECLVADYHFLDLGSLVLGWTFGQDAGRRLEAGQLAPLGMADCVELAGLNPASYQAHQALDDARSVRDVWDVVTGW